MKHWLPNRHRVLERTLQPVGKNRFFKEKNETETSQSSRNGSLESILDDEEVSLCISDSDYFENKSPKP